MNKSMLMKIATVPSDTTLQVGQRGKAQWLRAAQGSKVEEVVERSPSHRCANLFWQVIPPCTPVHREPYLLPSLLL